MRFARNHLGIRRLRRFCIPDYFGSSTHKPKPVCLEARLESGTYSSPAELRGTSEIWWKKRAKPDEQPNEALLTY
jgi:hypothetical protein